MSATPDPAFKRLLPTLRKMTALPIMLPTDLPPQLTRVAIGEDTREESYTILFLADNAPDNTSVVQELVNAWTRGTLSADPERGTGRFGDETPEAVPLPDGTMASLLWIERRGGSAGPASIGVFAEADVRYRLEIRGDESPSRALARQILSSIVWVP